MIFVNNDTFAKVWEISKKDKYAEVQISTSRKEKDSNERVYSHWYTRFIGDAFHKIDTIEKGTNITINRCMITNERYTANDGTKKSSLKVVVTDFTVDGETQQPAKKAPAKKASKPVAPAASEDDMPF